MIIHIDWKINTISEQYEADAHNVIGALIDAHLDGKHHVVFERLAVKVIRESGILSRTSQRRLDSIAEKYSSRGGVVLNGNIPVLRVLYDQDAVLECIDENNYSIGLRAFLKSNYKEKPILIVEGKEIEMYDFMIKAVAKRVGLKKISYEAGFGGGNSISDQLMAKIESRYIVVCICDNDKITPTGGVGDTLQRLRRMASGLHKFIGNTYETPGREVENFLPFDIVKEVPVSEDSKKDKERVKNQIENLKNLLNNQGQDHAKDCLWLYYDIKTRISMKRLSSHANDTESKEWIKKKYCIDEISEIEKIALPVWSDNLLSNVLSDNKKKKELNKFIDQPYFEYHFNEWFLKFIYFFAAGEIGRT